MAWQVRFVPNAVTSMTVSCNGEHALDWSSAEGDTVKNIPALWAALPHVHFAADGSPQGKNATCQFLWDGEFRYEMNFDTGEEWDS